MLKFQNCGRPLPINILLFHKTQDPKSHKLMWYVNRDIFTITNALLFNSLVTLSVFPLPRNLKLQKIVFLCKTVFFISSTVCKF